MFLTAATCLKGFYGGSSNISNAGTRAVALSLAAPDHQRHRTAPHQTPQQIVSGIILGASSVSGGVYNCNLY